MSVNSALTNAIFYIFIKRVFKRVTDFTVIVAFTVILTDPFLNIYLTDDGEKRRFSNALLFIL